MSHILRIRSLQTLLTLDEVYYYMELNLITAYFKFAKKNFFSYETLLWQLFKKLVYRNLRSFSLSFVFIGILQLLNKFIHL